MIDITVAVVEYTTGVELKSVARNTDWYWTIIKLIDEGPTVALLNVAKRGHFKTATVLFARIGNPWDGWGVWVVGVGLDTLNLHIGIRALQKPPITAICQPISRTIDHLLSRKRYKKTKLVNRIQRGHYVRSRKRITSSTHPLVPDFSRMDRPVNHWRTEIAWGWGRNRARARAQTRAHACAH